MKTNKAGNTALAVADKKADETAIATEATTTEPTTTVEDDNDKTETKSSGALAELENNPPKKPEMVASTIKLKDFTDELAEEWCNIGKYKREAVVKVLAGELAIDDVKADYKESVQKWVDLAKTPETLKEMRDYTTDFLARRSQHQTANAEYRKANAAHGTKVKELRAVVRGERRELREAAETARKQATADRKKAAADAKAAQPEKPKKTSKTKSAEAETAKTEEKSQELVAA